MFSLSLKHTIVLGLAFLASGALGAPVSDEAVLERRAVTNPCSSTIARNGADIATAATKCFDDISPHIFAGGKAGVLGSSSGAHLASRVLASAPQKAGRINAATLVMSAAVTLAAQAKVTTAEAALAKNVAKNKVKALQNAVTNAKAAVKALTPVQTLMLNTIKPAVPNPAELYTQAGIKTMCVEAMKKSIATNKNLLKGGNVSVTAPNLGKTVTVRLLEDKGRINSCFPV